MFSAFPGTDFSLEADCVSVSVLAMGRAPCCDKSKVKKGPWSPEEDATLKNYLQQHGTHGNWVALPSKAGLNRCGKSCRLRWLNYLRPEIKRGSFTEEEENLICTLFAAIGSRWSFIASQLPGRTDNDVKNYWNTKLKKKVLLAPENNSIMATTNYNSTVINLPQFSASIPKIETPLHDHETNSSSCFDGTLPYQMDVSCLGQGKQNFNPCSQFSHSNIMEVSSVPTSSTLALENNWTLWSGNEGVNDSSGFLMDYGFESPGDVLLDGFGY